MNKITEQPKKQQKIFKKIGTPLITSSNPLHQCLLMQISKYDKKKPKEWYFRIYEEFMIISNVKFCVFTYFY